MQSGPGSGPAKALNTRPASYDPEFAMSEANTVLNLNEELARKINDEARSNPHSPYAHKFVGLANGQVVIVADSLDEVARFLRRTEPDLARAFIVEASRDPDEVVDIQSAC
jgi:hypothetical protein